jgi:hypothetical protein
MGEPQAGLKALTQVLKDDGFMTIALYSKIARRNINLVRNEVKSLNPSHENITKIRQDILSSSDSDPKSTILNSTDFYSTSGCRD